MVVHGPYPVGEPRVAREAAVACAEGFAVDVVAMRRKGEPAREVVDGVGVVRLPLEHRRDTGFARVVVEYVAFTLAVSLVVALRHLRRRYDVVQVHNPPDFLVTAALLPRLMGARVIFDVHDLSTHMFAARFGGWGAGVARPLLRALQRAATRAADAVLTVHEPYRRELASEGVDPETVTVVMNTVDERLLPETTPAAAPGPPRIVYHGTITPSYGVDLLIAAAERLRDRFAFNVELYGEGDALAAIRAAADATGIGDRLRASGTYLPHREVLLAVAGAAVGVIPNRPGELNRFALSSKLFEYVALGIPVVCADLPTLRAHFCDAEIRFFRAGDAGSLADAIADVLAEPEVAAARAARARLRYEDYRWGLQASRYAGVLNELTRA